MFKLKAPAKINWSLYVLNNRDDNYHNILSLMHCIGLYDTLTFEHSDRIELIADTDIPSEQNLVFKAAKIFQKYIGTKSGVKITLEKKIPTGAGLGGGSSNAAHTLMGLNNLWGSELNTDELKMIGSKLGSDVPFFFACPIAIAKGRGEILTPLTVDTSFTLLLIKPLISISTIWAYEKIRDRNKRQYGYFSEAKLTKIEDKVNNIRLISKTLKTGDVSTLKFIVHNDFEDIAIKRHPVIGSLKKELLDAGATLALMSGSGSTVFGLFEDRKSAVSASKNFTSYWNKIVQTNISRGERRSPHVGWKPHIG